MTCGACAGLADEAVAMTVNGSIHVAMASAGSADELEYSTVNDALTIELPDNFGAQLDLSTVNGWISSGFPITVSGALSSHRLRGTMGDGRTKLEASMVNGSITLRHLN